MTSENYRQLLNNEFEAKEMTKEDFDNTLMHFAMLYHKEQLKLYSVVVNEAKIIDKQSQEKLIVEMMEADEELGLYSEVELVCNRINNNNANRCINCGVKAGHPCGLQTN